MLETFYRVIVHCADVTRNVILSLQNKNLQYLMPFGNWVNLNAREIFEVAVLSQRVQSWRQLSS